MRRNNTIRYLTVTAFAGVSLLLGVAVFNYIVDPFGMNMVVQSNNLNTYKPGTYNRVRLFKAYESMRARPQTLILGTSRSHIGFSCKHEALKKLEGPCYNMAFDGATSREIYTYLKHAYAIRPIKHVLLGIEPWHLAESLGETQPGFDPLILRDPEGDFFPRWLTGDLRILTSLDTFKASIQTIKSQAVPDPTWFSADGQRIGEVFFREVDGRFEQLTPRGYFYMVNEQEVGYKTAWKVVAKHTKTKLRAPVPTNPEETSRAYVRHIVAFCRKHNIDLRIVITPAHVHQMEITAASGNYQSVEKKKRDLLKIVSEENTRFSALGSTPVYDFSGYSKITTESPPAPGLPEEMKYYWDSSHFKQLVGDYVLDRVYGVHNPSRIPPGSFGVQLTEENIDTYLSDQRKLQSQYRIQYPKDVALLRQLVASALEQ